MRNVERENWISEVPPPYRDQKHFDSWDFISTNTLKVEFGIANEMDQYDRNFKVRRIMGEQQKEKPTKRLETRKFSGPIGETIVNISRSASNAFNRTIGHRYSV